MRRITWRAIGRTMGTRPEPVWALLLCGLITLGLFAAGVPVAGWLRAVMTVMLFALAVVAWLGQ